MAGKVVSMSKVAIIIPIYNVEKPLNQQLIKQKRI